MEFPERLVESEVGFPKLADVKYDPDGELLSDLSALLRGRLDPCLF